MEVVFRPFTASHADEVVALSIRAWGPVFDSIRGTVGDAIFSRLYPNWMEDQEDAVRAACAGHAGTTWVAEFEAKVRGFVVVVLHDKSPIGEIEMLAVDPASQRCGVGRALTDFAIDRIKDSGKAVAMVSTGGDPGHGPARRTYASAGFTLMPIHRYLMAL